MSSNQDSKISAVEEYFTMIMEKEKRKNLYRCAYHLSAARKKGVQNNISDAEIAERYNVPIEFVIQHRYKKT